MAVSPNIFINYVSEFKKCFITRNNGIIKQKFKIDSSINDDYYFQIINSNNQIVSLSGRQFEIYGSFVDNKGTTHILFYSPTGDIQNDVLHFKINTFTTEYLTYIRTNKIADVTIVEKVNSDTQVVLRDQGIFYKRPNIGDVPPGSVYSAGEGLKLEGSTFVLTGTVLSGDGETIQINDNVISCIGGGGANYTAGSGIAISQDNVISLSATIPSATSQLVNDSDYIAYVSSPDSSLEIKYFSPDGVQIKVASGFINNYALTSAIPLSTSQLTNDSNFITSNELSNYIITGTVPGDDAGIRLRVKGNNDSVRISWLVNDMYYTTWRQVQETLIAKGYLTAVPSTYALKTDVPSAVSQLTNDSGYITTAALSDYATTGQLDTVSTAIPLSTSQLINDDGFITSSALTGISTDKLQTIVVDSTVRTSGYIMQYNPSADIVYNTIETNSGLLKLNPISGFESDIEVGKVATFENWIKPQGALTGVSIDNGLDLIGDLPSSYTNKATQVFTRRIVRLASGTDLQQISYNYQFSVPEDYQNMPFTFECTNGTVNISLPLFHDFYMDEQPWNDSNSTISSLYYKKTGDSTWTDWKTQGFTAVTLSQGEELQLSGLNGGDFYKSWGNKENRFYCSGAGKLIVKGNVSSLFASDVTSISFGALFMGTGGDVSPEQTYITDASKLLVPYNLINNNATFRFYNQSAIENAPLFLGSAYGSDMFAGTFVNCYNLSAVEMGFVTNSEWSFGEFFQSVPYEGLFIKPSGLVIPSERGSSTIPDGWTILNRINGYLYYAQSGNGHSVGDPYEGVDPYEWYWKNHRS